MSCHKGRVGVQRRITAALMVTMIVGGVVMVNGEPVAFSFLSGTERGGGLMSVLSHSFDLTRSDFCTPASHQIVARDNEGPPDRNQSVREETESYIKSADTGLRAEAGSALDPDQAVTIAGLRAVSQQTKTLVLAYEPSRLLTSVTGLRIGLDAVETSFPKFEQQYGGSGAPGSGAFGTMIPDPTTTLPQLGLQVIPMITVSERYDTNVFFSPGIPGIKPDDFVTTVSPQLSVRGVGRLITTTLLVGASGEYYVRNPVLNYIGYSASIALDLTQLAQRLQPGATLRIADSFTYTPQPPGFLGGDHIVNQVGGPDITSQLSPAEQYARGIQAFRVNTYSNSTSIGGSYPLSSSVNFQAAYAYSLIKFGTPFVQTNQPSVFDSTTHYFTAGPSVKPSPRDTLALSFEYQRSDFDTGTYETQGGTLSWKRTVTPLLNTRVFAGASQLKQENTQFAGQMFPTSQIAYTGGASLSWSIRETTVSLSYTAGIYPSYFIGAGPTLSQVFTAGGTHQMTDNLRLFAGADYSRNEALGSSAVANSFFWESYAANVGLSYRLTPNTLASLNESFSFNRGSYGLIGVSSNEFTRNIVILSLTHYWK